MGKFLLFFLYGTAQLQPLGTEGDGGGPGAGSHGAGRYTRQPGWLWLLDMPQVSHEGRGWRPVPDVSAGTSAALWYHTMVGLTWLWPKHWDHHL